RRAWAGSRRGSRRSATRSSAWRRTSTRRSGDPGVGDRLRVAPAPAARARDVRAPRARRGDGDRRGPGASRHADPLHRGGHPPARADPDSVRAPTGVAEGRGDRARPERCAGGRDLLRARRDLLTVQAFRGGSPELRPLEAARAGRATAVAGEEPVRVPIEDALDLHAFAPRDIPSVVSEYLEAAHARGFTEVRLIHG